MKRNKKIKKKYAKNTHYIFLFVILLFILGIVIYKFKSQKISNDNHVHYVNDIIRDASYHLRLDKEYKKKEEEENKLLTETNSNFL